MSTKPPKKTDFHFVTGNPRTDNERRVVRTIVRSNASNRRWRLARETAARSKLARDDTSDVAKKIDHLTRLNRHDISEADTANSRQVRKQRLDEKHARRYDQVAVRDQRQPESLLKIANLAQHHFGNMPDTDVSKVTISRMLQGTATSYAALFPSGKSTVVSQMAKDWFQQCLKTRGILHTALFCQAMRTQAVQPGSVSMSSNELVLCQTEAVHAINDKLTKSATTIDDESIRIVFSLMWHGAIQQRTLLESPRQAPMADLQALRLFMGAIVCDPIHAQGLDNMLALRGGVEKIEMPGLAFLVSLGDILKASCTLRRPTWTYGSYAQHVPDAAVGAEWLKSVRRTDHLLASLGSGFASLTTYLPHEKASSIQLVFLDLADYTRATYDFMLGPPELRNRAVMADQRNSAQHKLMSLRLLDDEQFDQRDIYDLCWLVGVAYSMIAVFPLSPKAARFDRLARLIRSKMMTVAVVDWWASAIDMMLWMTTIGALCAIGTPDRDWYVTVLRQECERLNIVHWNDLKLLLMQYLWFPPCSDADGQELWVDVQIAGRVIPWKEESVTG